MTKQDATGKVYLIGAGPGDPDLLTIKAARVLQQCDVILYDRLVTPEILTLANPAAELIYVGKHEGEQDCVQNRIFDLLLQHARQGKTIGRLKGGDPLIFGRGAEEWKRLVENGFPVEYIPGVSSAMAVPGIAGIPLTHRGISQSFAVVSGHCQEEAGQRWSNYSRIETLVVLMGVKNRVHIARALIEAGRMAQERVAFVERGSTPSMQVVQGTLGQVAEGSVSVQNPAVWIIGAVASLHTQLFQALG